MTRLLVIALLVASAGMVLAGDAPPVFLEGRVVDVSGQPVANVDVGTFWSANGLKGTDDNKAVNLQDRGQLERFWGNVGQMALWPWKPTEHMRTGPDGTFRIKSDWRRHQVLALNADQTLGGIGVVPSGAKGQPITVTLAPLVRVIGQIRGPESDRKPAWTHVYVEHEILDRPTDTFRLISCGSFDARFSMLLPPGRYQLHAYEEDSGEVQPYPTLTLLGTEGTVDLGTLLLSKKLEGVRSQIEKSKAVGRWRDLKDLVGQEPPPISADAAQGVPADWQAGRSLGKWQLIEFWGVSCAPCLGRSLPELMRFQASHASQANRFEIVTVFIDDEEKIRTVMDLDRNLQPIIKHTWAGQALPFPILIDPSFRTWESWGLRGLGDQVLINPEGKIVAGDLETLRGILDKP